MLVFAVKFSVNRPELPLEIDDFFKPFFGHEQVINA